MGDHLRPFSVQMLIIGPHSCPEDQGNLQFARMLVGRLNQDSSIGNCLMPVSPLLRRRNSEPMESFAMLRNIVAAITVIVPSLVIAQPASKPRPAITGISHVTLFADDIPKSEQFYAKLLGWEQVPSNAAKPGARFYANHSQYVELVSPPSPGLADRLDLVAFSTSDAEALRKYLGANGVAVPRAPYHRGGWEPKLPRP